MGLAKKLREVVAANFIEIARVETPPVKQKEVVPEPAPEPVGLEADRAPFLDDSAAATAAPPAEPEQEPPLLTVLAEEPIEEPAPATVRLADAVSDEGDVDFASVFHQYELPAVAFSAEQAMGLLQSLPRDFSLRTKRVTVNTTLSAIGKAVGATPQDIVADASRKKEALGRYVGSLGQEVDEATVSTQAEIDRLLAEVNAHKDALRSLARKRSAAAESCQARSDMFDQVIHFFDYDDDALAQAEPAADEEAAPIADEMPAFMHEDAVRRMLGITEDFTDENGEFDAAKFAQMYGDGTGEPELPAQDGPEDGARRPRAKK